MERLAPGSQPHRALWDTVATALLLPALIARCWPSGATLDTVLEAAAIKPSGRLSGPAQRTFRTPCSAPLDALREPFERDAGCRDERYAGPAECGYAAFSEPHPADDEGDRVTPTAGMTDHGRADELRAAMVDGIARRQKAVGRVLSADVRRALLTVPRHLFAEGDADLEGAPTRTSRSSPSAMSGACPSARCRLRGCRR